MPEGDEYENPQVCLALSDLLRVKRIPTRGENIPSQLLVNIEAPRELHLQAYRLTLVSLASYKQVHANVLRWYPNVVLMRQLSVDIVPN